MDTDMQFYLRNFLHIPQLQIHILSLQHWLDQADGNIANKSIDEKHKYKSTHEHNTYLGYQCGYITFGIYRKNPGDLWKNIGNIVNK